MRSQHLKQVGDIWHCQCRYPNEFSDLEPRSLIRFSLKTRDYSEAHALAANHSLRLEKVWRDAKKLGLSFQSKDAAEQYNARFQQKRRWR